MKKYALLSVTDKAGVVEFASELISLGYEVLSTGGTAAVLKENGVSYTAVSSFTGQKEIMDGRVKTLHPKIHGGVLARREVQSDLSELAELDGGTIDIVAVNLYPFVKVLNEGLEKTEEEMVEYIDIGGPTLLRAAAKNFKYVYSVIEPKDYQTLIEKLKSNDDDLNFRRTLSAKVFAHIAAYDLRIASYLSQDFSEEDDSVSLPKYVGTVSEKIQGLRYGENPDQVAGWYTPLDRMDQESSSLRQIQGKELSYNNLNDIYAAADLMLDVSHGFEGKQSVVIIKHANPCGVAVAETVQTAFSSALACDPVSAFGGIIAFSGALNHQTASELVKSFYEVIIAPSFEEKALEILTSKKNLRVIKIDYSKLRVERNSNLQFKTVIEGSLIQSHDNLLPEFSELKWVVGTSFESDVQKQDALLANIVSKHVKSNAIVLAKNGSAMGIGAGQMNRVDSSRIAITRARNHDFDVAGSVVASDAFLPFSDNIDTFSEAGISLVVQPGGSIRDNEVIEVAKAKGINMVFTGKRHFRH